MALVSVPAAGGTVISITGQVLTLLALLVQKYKYRALDPNNSPAEGRVRYFTTHFTRIIVQKQYKY